MNRLKINRKKLIFQSYTKIISPGWQVWNNSCFHFPDLLSIFSKMHIYCVYSFVFKSKSCWGEQTLGSWKSIKSRIANLQLHFKSVFPQTYFCIFHMFFPSILLNIPLNKNNPFLVDRASYIFLFAISCDRTFNLSTSQVLFWPFVPDNVFLIGQPFFYLTTFLGSGILQSGTFGAPEFWCLGTKTLVPQMILTVLFC